MDPDNRKRKLVEENLTLLTQMVPNHFQSEIKRLGQDIDSVMAVEEGVHRPKVKRKEKKKEDGASVRSLEVVRQLATNGYDVSVVKRDGSNALIANRDFKKGEYITEYNGYVIPFSQWLRDHTKFAHLTTLSVGRWYIDGEYDGQGEKRTSARIGEGAGAFAASARRRERINAEMVTIDGPKMAPDHSNANVERIVVLRAIRDISRDTEIGVARNIEYWRDTTNSRRLNDSARSSLRQIYRVNIKRQDLFTDFPEFLNSSNILDSFDDANLDRWVVVVILQSQSTRFEMFLRQRGYEYAVDPLQPSGQITNDAFLRQRAREYDAEPPIQRQESMK